MKANSNPVLVAPAQPQPYEHILYPRDPAHADAGRLASFLANLRYEDIPKDVIHLAKLLTLDTIGCIVAGAETELGKKILAAYGAPGAQGGCAVAGTSLRLPPSVAAKVNGWLSDVLDYEDVAAGHPSATVIPAALAIAEHFGSDSKKFIAGIVGGYEAGLRIHDATVPSPEVYRRFAVYHAWHGLAAGAAAMVTAGGTDEQFRSALGHAAANTNLPLWYVEYGRPAHALKANYGQMALGGVDAALCARRDVIGPFAMLSDPLRGFASIIGSDKFSPGELSAGLNEVWRTRQACLKAYPCCALLHTSFDAVAQLVRRHGIDHKNVESVKIRSFAKLANWFSDRAPSTALDGQFSVEYVAAMAMLRIEPGRDWYSTETMKNLAACRLMQATTLEVDPSAEENYWRDQYTASVSIQDREGRTYSETVDWPPGHWKRPFTNADVEQKFLRNLRGTRLEGRGPSIVEVVSNLEREDSLENLIALLSVPLD